MSRTNWSTWGHRGAGPLRTLTIVVTAVAVVVSACGNDADDPASLNGPATSEATTSQAASGEAESGEDQTDQTVGADEPWDQLPFVLQSVASLSEPTSLTSRPGSDHLWITERTGRVRLVERHLDAEAGTEVLTQVAEPVLDIGGQVDAGGEGGLLGMAFSPDGQHLYLHYTDRSFHNVISEFPIGDTTADGSAERILLRIEQPFSNHNGGDLRFGPDGMLYISIGDGGSADDPLGSGQDTSTLLATLLRIDPTPMDSSPYTVPPDNPFASGQDGRPEIWMWGLRNPWRFSFDAQTDDLWIGDVGQNQIEEIDFLPAGAGGAGGAGRGANMGWNLVEGNREFAGSPPPDHVSPIHTYDHDNGRCSVTGGSVYRGTNTPSLWGVYLFADYCTGEIWGIERNGDGSTTVAGLNLDRNAGPVVSFGEGPAGEVYVLDLNGRVSRIQSPNLLLETTISSR